MTIDGYLDRKYHKLKYNCRHFVVEAMQGLAGVDFSGILHGAPAVAMRRVRFLERPVSPCVVYMQRRNGDSHVGIWYNKKVLHITANGGVQYVPLDVAAAGFRIVRFLTCQ